MATELNRNSNLGTFFEARSVAVIGSFKEAWMGGYGVVKNLLNFGFCGNIHPINPSYSEVLGMTAYPTVNHVTDPIDLAVIITPSHVVPQIIEQCAHKGVKAAIIVSDGFAETSREGARLQRQLVDIARSFGIRIIGPNTIGIVNTATGLVTTPYYTGYNRIQRGAIAYASQTGIAGAQALPLEDCGYPISKICDFGNKCDVNEIDLLEYLAADPETEVIAIHLEDIKDGQQFMATARSVVAHKPVLILKPGRSEASAKAVASHTGSLAGPDQIYDSAFKQAGIVRLDTWQEFLDVPKVFASQPLPAGNRVAIVTVSGAAGIIAIDAATESGLTVAELSSVTIDKLASLSPRLASNPVDIGQVATLVNAGDFTATLESTMATVLADNGVDCAIMALWATSTSEAEATADMFRQLRQQFSKAMAIWIYGPKLSARDELSRQLEVLGVPTYLNLETAAKALGIAATYAKVKSRLNW